MKIFVEFLAIFIALQQLNSVCGIHHGSEATKHQFPYSVLVHSPQFFCAGALISDRHVMTAAHCLMSIKKGGSAKVNVGAHRYYGNGVSDGKTILSKTFWIHENFTMPSAVYDIGLIELPDPLPNNEKYQWLKLSTRPDDDLDAEDKEIVVAGWGYTENYEGAAIKLRYTKMNLIPLNVCMKYKSHYIEDMNENHICTEKIQGMPCSGDSGSVLVSTKTNKIIGIVSYVKDAEDGIELGYNDCDSKIPVVSTRISSYLDWISQKTGIDFRGKKKQGNFNDINIDDSGDFDDVDEDFQRIRTNRRINRRY